MRDDFGQKREERQVAITATQLVDSHKYFATRRYAFIFATTPCALPPPRHAIKSRRLFSPLSAADDAAAALTFYARRLKLLAMGANI